MSIFLINGRLAVINGSRKMRNPPSWQVIFIAVPFKKMPLFSKDLITFITLFHNISLFVSVSTEPSKNPGGGLLLLIKLHPASKRAAEMFSPFLALSKYNFSWNF